MMYVAMLATYRYGYYDRYDRASDLDHHMSNSNRTIVTKFCVEFYINCVEIIQVLLVTHADQSVSSILLLLAENTVPLIATVV